MAGIDDYEFYSNLRYKDSPFWQKYEKSINQDKEIQSSRPCGFMEKFQSPTMDSAQTPTLMGKVNVSDPSDTYSETCITLITICAENLLSHPFIVLKRQCQVNGTSLRYHLQPVTLIPVFIHIQAQQGISAFWKGLGSVLTIRGVTMALEDSLSKFTPWPKEISPHSSLKTIGQHLMLKCATLAIITPFYSASLVETVQSEITSERPGILDVFREGLYRLISFTQPQTGRMLPVWTLILPTVFHGISQYIIGNAVSTAVARLLRYKHKKEEQNKGAISRDTSLTDATIRLQAACIGHCISDVILYPLETILHRLYLQGTRTIIDCLDSGYEVKPILTKYEGFFDCGHTIIKEEGVLGLFKGFGALCIQYAAYTAALKFTHVIIREVGSIMAPKKPKSQHQATVPPLTPGAPYPTVTSGGSSSLHASPLHNNKRRHHRDSGAQWGSVDLGDMKSVSPNVNLRAEVAKYREALDTNP